MPSISKGNKIAEDSEKLAKEFGLTKESVESALRWYNANDELPTFRKCLSQIREGTLQISG